VANGSHSVTGIEINPIIATEIMRDRYADFAYHLYQRPEVHMHIGDGRSFIRNAKENFDVVQMTLVDTTRAYFAAPLPEPRAEPAPPRPLRFEHPRDKRAARRSYGGAGVHYA